jgi:hypothetical protein
MQKSSKILKKLKNDINKFFKVSIEASSKTNDEVYARLIYYKLAKVIDPTITSTELGNTVNRDHATVLYSIKKFDVSYVYDKKFKYLYDSFMLNNPEYLQEVYLKEVYVDIQESLSKTIDFVCSLEVEDRKKFIDELETLKRLFINDLKIKCEEE